MKKLTQEVKEGGLKKWKVSFKRKMKAEVWFNEEGCRPCSFCEYYDHRYNNDCICILHDESFACCKEFAAVTKMIDGNHLLGFTLKIDVKLKDFNLACQALYNRITSLEVGK